MAPTDKHPFQKRYIVFVAVLALGLYVLLPQFGDFRTSWSFLRRLDPLWTVAAVSLTALTYLAGAATYRWLAFKPLAYGRTVLVQLAAMFINRLLPGGIGALGANYLYLRRAKHSKAQAACVVAVNNLFGFMGHGILLTAVVVISLVLNANSKLDLGNTSTYKYLPVILLVGGLAIVFAMRTRLSKTLLSFWKQLLKYRDRRGRLGLALSSSMALTLANVLSFYCCAMALGVELSPLAVFLVFSFGVGASIATPTPGGLGGFEAGLVAGLVAYDVDAPLALAIALLYRLISYWLALAAGAIAFAVCQRRKLLFS